MDQLHLTSNKTALDLYQGNLNFDPNPELSWPEFDQANLISSSLQKDILRPCPKMIEPKMTGLKPNASQIFCHLQIKNAENKSGLEDPLVRSLQKHKQIF